MGRGTRKLRLYHRELWLRNRLFYWTNPRCCGCSPDWKDHSTDKYHVSGVLTVVLGLWLHHAPYRHGFLKKRPQGWQLPRRDNGEMDPSLADLLDQVLGCVPGVGRALDCREQVRWRIADQDANLVSLPYLFPHLLEVIKELQGSAKSFSDEATAFTSTSHEHNTVQPLNKLISAAGGSVTLDVGLWRTVYSVEDHKTILGAAVISSKVSFCWRAAIKIFYRGEKVMFPQRLKVRSQISSSFYNKDDIGYYASISLGRCVHRCNAAPICFL